MKRTPLFLLAAFALSAEAAGPVPPPAASGPTVVVLGSSELAEVKKQASLLRSGRAKLDERKIDIQGEQRPGGVLHKRFGHGPGFLIVLVGSNGEEKLRSLQPVGVDRLVKTLEDAEKNGAAAKPEAAPAKP